MDQPVVFPTKNVFAPETIEVEGPSKVKYTLRELTGFEQMQADSYCKVPSQALYYRIGCAIQTVGDETIAPREDKPFVDGLLRKIPGGDVEAMMQAYVKAFSPELAADLIKNA